MSNLQKKIGANVRKIRKQKKVTIDDLSYEARVSRSTIYRIEEGLVDSRLSTLESIAKVLKVKISKLFE